MNTDIVWWVNPFVEYRGARPLKRLIQQRIENPLATKILGGEFGPGDTIGVDVAGKSFTFENGGRRVVGAV